MTAHAQSAHRPEVDRLQLARLVEVVKAVKAQVVGRLDARDFGLGEARWRKLGDFVPNDAGAIRPLAILCRAE